MHVSKHYHSHFPSFLMTRSFCQTWACAWINQHWTARSIGPIVQNVWPTKRSLLTITRRISIAGSPPSTQWKWYIGSLNESKWQIVSTLTEVGMFRCGLAGLVHRVNISAALSRHWLQCFQDRQKEAEDGADLEFGTGQKRNVGYIFRKEISSQIDWRKAKKEKKSTIYKMCTGNQTSPGKLKLVN